MPPWNERLDWALRCGAAYGAICALAALIHRRRGLGRQLPLGIGDAALAALIGALLGERAPETLLVGQLLAAAAGAYIILRRPRHPQHKPGAQRRIPGAQPAVESGAGRAAADEPETIPLGGYLSLAAITWLCLS